MRTVDHPHGGVCLDIGHAFLAASYLGSDVLASIRDVAPLVTHLHLSATVGRVQLAPDAILEESFALGNGDLHLPAGWGAIPLAAVVAIPFLRPPIVIVELRPHFREHVADARPTTVNLLTRHSRATLATS